MTKRLSACTYRAAFSVLLSVLLIGCGTTHPSSSTDDRGVAVQDKVVSDDLLVAGEAVRVPGEVRGDVAAAGASVTITGPVGGYVMSAGRHVVLTGSIANDVWAAGETVDVNSHVGNNVRAAGSMVHLGASSVIERSARLAGNAVVAEGRIERDLRIRAATARIGADVGGTVEVQAARVIIEPGAVIGGDLRVRSPEPPEVSPQAQVRGAVQHERIAGGPWWATRPWLWALCFAALLLLGLAALAFSPRWAARVEGTMTRRPGVSTLAGVLVLMLTPLVAAALMMTVIGIPLALVLLALYTITLLLAAVFVSYRTGHWVFDRMHRSAPHWGYLLLGVAIVSLGILMPFVGWIVGAAVLVVGVGALALERWDFRGELRRAALM